MKIDCAIRNKIRDELRQDIGRGDVTTRVMFPKGKKVEFEIRAKASGVLSGVSVAREVFKVRDKKVSLRITKKDGAKVKCGAVILRGKGDVRSVLAAERTALNFLTHLSGIATLTRKFVDKVKPYRAIILDTRKTLPGLRKLEKYAVRSGGGSNHRMGLDSFIMVKDNHIAAVDDCQKCGCHARLREAKRTVEIEADSLARLKRVLDVQPDIVLLDNMPIKNLRKAVRMIKSQRPHPQIEVSGGVDLKNVRRIAACGVDRISIGALTHSAPALDFSLEIQ